MIELVQLKTFLRLYLDTKQRPRPDLTPAKLAHAATVHTGKVYTPDPKGLGKAYTDVSKKLEELKSAADDAIPGTPEDGTAEGI